MRNLLAIIVMSGAVQALAGQCSVQDKVQLARAGYSKAEIEAACAASASKSDGRLDPFQEALKREKEHLKERKQVENSAPKLGRSETNLASATRNKVMVGYLGLIRSKIRGNIVMPREIKGNPEAVFDVTQLPSGEIVTVRLTRSSGNAALDGAIERAILQSSPLPKPQQAELFSRSLELRFRPLEEPCSPENFERDPDCPAVAPASTVETQAIRCASLAFVHTSLMIPGFNESMMNLSQLYSAIYSAQRGQRTSTRVTNGEVSKRREDTLNQLRKTWSGDSDAVIREFALCNEWRAAIGANLPGGDADIPVNVDAAYVTKIVPMPPLSPTPTEMEKWRRITPQAFDAWATAGYATKHSVTDRVKQLREDGLTPTR
jgi:hypothetical protein